MYSIDDETSIELMYLPGNGAFLQVSVLDNRLPAAESTLEEQVQAFLTQLDTTLDGSWEQTTTENGLEYKHTSGVLRVVRYAPDEVDFALCVTLDPDVYGGLDTLSNVVIGPDGLRMWSSKRLSNFRFLRTYFVLPCSPRMGNTLV